jgi:hypothetical protein
LDFLSLHGARIAARLTAAPEYATRNDLLCGAGPAADGEQERHLIASVCRSLRTGFECEPPDAVDNGGEPGRAGAQASSANVGAIASNGHARLQSKWKTDSVESRAAHRPKHGATANAEAAVFASLSCI